MGISRRACETSHSGPHLPSLMRYALKFGVIHFAFLKSSLVMLTYVSSEGHTWRELGTKGMGKVLDGAQHQHLGEVQWWLSSAGQV